MIERRGVAGIRLMAGVAVHPGDRVAAPAPLLDDPGRDGFVAVQAFLARGRNLRQLLRGGQRNLSRNYQQQEKENQER
jgi:hypothetical protein